MTAESFHQTCKIGKDFWFKAPSCSTVWMFIFKEPSLSMTRRSEVNTSYRFSQLFFFPSFGLLSCVPATFSVLWGKCESMPELVDFLYPSHQGFWAMQRSDVTRGKHAVAFYLIISLKQSMHGVIEAPLSWQFFTGRSMTTQECECHSFTWLI